MATAKKTAAGTWKIQVYAGKVNGKRQYIQFTRPSKREAELAALQWQGTRPDRAEMTLRDAYRRYVEDQDASLSQSTLREYHRIAERSTSPIMEKQIERITLADVKRTVNELTKKYALKTVKNRYGLFTAVMHTFCPDRSFRVKMRREPKKDVYVPEPETIDRLYQKAKGKWIELPFLLASQCGFRASEIAGLKYDCIDHENNAIIVKRAVVASTDGYAEKEPKSYAGFRTIPCHPALIEAVGVGQPDEYVIPGGNRNHIPARWHEFIVETGETPFSFHKLRHYFASRALLAGIPKKYVAELMGHSSENMLNQVYEHTFKNARSEFASELPKIGVFEADANLNANIVPKSPIK